MTDLQRAKKIFYDANRTIPTYVYEYIKELEKEIDKLVSEGRI